MGTNELQKLYERVKEVERSDKWKVCTSLLNNKNIWDYSIKTEGNYEFDVISASLTDPREVYYRDLPTVRLNMARSVADFIVYVFNNCQDIINKLKEAESKE